MKRLLIRRPSASMVVALTALVVALGGTAIAATKLMSGDKLIKKRTLSGNRLRKHTITGTQVNLKKLGKVPTARSADVAKSATNAGHATAADTAASAATATHAGSADSATNAGHATTADTATTAASANSATTATDAAHATTADTVAGVTVKGFAYQTPSNGSKAVLFTMNGLTVTATCSAGRIDATTSVDHAYISSSWVSGASTPARATDTDFNTNETFLASSTTGAETGSIEYVRPGGQRVSVSLQSDLATACTVSGHAFGSG